MTCIQISNCIICGNFSKPKRLKRKGTSTRAVYYDNHPYLGPDFYSDKNCYNLLKYEDVPKWVWDEYQKLYPPKTLEEIESDNSKGIYIYIDD